MHLQQVLFQGTPSQASAAPEVVASEPAAPEPAAPEVVVPEVVAPEPAAPEVAAPEVAAPEPAAQRSRAAWMTERTSVQYREAADLSAVEFVYADRASFASQSSSHGFRTTPRHSASSLTILQRRP